MGYDVSRVKLHFASHCTHFYAAVADPGFPAGGGGRGLPRRLCFVKFVCQNERIGSLGGGVHAGCAPPKSTNVLDVKHPRQYCISLKGKPFLYLTSDTFYSKTRHKDQLCIKFKFSDSCSQFKLVTISHQVRWKKKKIIWYL